MTAKGVRITAVEKGSPAQRLGLVPGDEILSVNGRPVADELALRFYLAEEEVRIEVLRADGSTTEFGVDLSLDSSLGIRVEEFRTRTCNNACLFCFIDQLPPGVRANLKVKDDDYRLSFLHGNYITLTNLSGRELDRIVEHALSPLYVSVHATDPILRTRMLGRRKADDLDGKMRKLIAGGIRLHTQVVLMPGINDGPHLEKTVFDLYGYHPGVNSVAIVPLGLSEHGPAKHTYAPVTASYCRELLSQVAPWQEKLRRETGRTFAYLADEWYLQGGVPLPAAVYYDEFAQIEDGVGMVRRFLDDFNAEMRRRPRAKRQLRATLVTGGLFRPVLSDCIARFNRRFDSGLQVVGAENRFLGRTITVAGLLGGQDIADALRSVDLGDSVIIPQESVSRVDGRLIDNLTPEDISLSVAKPVFASGRTVRDFFALLLDQS